MMNKNCFLMDKKGRVPFAVLGVFLIIGSAVTSNIIINLEKEKAKELVLPEASIKEKYVIFQVEKNLAEILNYAGMKAMAELGKKPITKPSASTDNPFYRIDLNEDGFPDIQVQELLNQEGLSATLNYIESKENEYPDVKEGLVKWLNLRMDGSYELSWEALEQIAATEKQDIFSQIWHAVENFITWIGSKLGLTENQVRPDASTIERWIKEELKDKGILETNKNYARNLTMDFFWKEVKTHFVEGLFKIGNYLFTIDNEFDHTNWNQIRIEEIIMRIEGRTNPPFASHSSNHPVYWVLSINMPIKIINLDTGEHYIRHVNISTLITSRIPLLMSLTREFERDLNGTLSPFGVESTAALLALTWLRGYAQFFTSEPANIVSNDYLSLIVNAALIAEEGFVFNTVDLMTVLFISYNTFETILKDFGFSLGESLADVEDFIQGGLSDINEARERLSYWMNNLPTSFEFAFNDEASELVEEHSTQHFNLTTFAERVYVELLNCEELINDIREAYTADVKIKINRIDPNPNSYNEILDVYGKAKEESKEDETLYSDEAWNKATKEYVDEWTIDSVTFNKAWNSEESTSSTVWHLEPGSKELLGTGFYEDKSPDYVVLYGEQWKFNRYRDWTFKWSSYSKWCVEVHKYVSYTIGNITYTKRVDDIKYIQLSHSHSITLREWKRGEMVTIRILSDHFSDIKNSDGRTVEGINNIVRPFKPATFKNYADPNMNDVLEKYKSHVGWSESFIDEILRGNSQQYQDNKISHEATIEGDNPSWVELEILNEINALINNRIADIEVEVSKDEYSTPQQLADIATQRITDAFENAFNSLKDIPSFSDGERFYSAGAKAIYVVKERYLETLMKVLKDEFDSGESEGIIGSIENFFHGIWESITSLIDDVASNAVNEAINFAFDAMERHTENADYNVDKFNENATIAHNQMDSFSFLTRSMRLIKEGNNGWNEDISLSIHQEPPFLDPNPNNQRWGDNQSYRFNVRNINLFSPGAAIGEIIDNLIEQGFDTLNEQIIFSIDRLFNLIEEQIISETDESFDEIDTELQELVSSLKDNIRDNILKIRDEHKKGLLEFFENDTYLEENFIEEVDNMDEVLDNAITVVFDSYGNDMESLKTFIRDLNSTTLVTQLVDEIYDAVIQNINEEIDRFYEEIIREKILLYVKMSLKGAISEAISMVSDEIKNLYTDMSELLENKIRGMAQGIAEQTVKKINSIIPAGLPILPPFGWWCTINVWYVEVSGEIPYFKVIDSSLDSVPNYLKGNEPMEYVRTMLEETITTREGVIVGDSLPIEFGFKTGTFIVVPPGGTGVGDRVGGWDENNYSRGE